MPFAGMLLFTVSPVDHTEAVHAQWGAVSVNGNEIQATPVTVQVYERPDLSFLAEPVSGIVVMCGVQADIADRDIGVKGPEFPEEDNSGYAVIEPGVQETDMQGQVHTVLRIVGTEHVKGVTEIKGFLITVLIPAGIRV